MIDCPPTARQNPSSDMLPTIVSMFDTFVDPTRRVAAPFFKAMANTKFAVDKQPPAYFLIATLVVHTAAKEQDNDVSKLIKHNEVEPLSAGSKRHDAAMQANAHILRANQLLTETGLPGHITVLAKFNLGSPCTPRLQI